MSETVVVFVTRTGHSKALAENVAERAGAKALEIGDLVNRKGITGFIRSGFQATHRRATPIQDPGADLSSAKTVILVQPVWAGAICPPLRTWLQAHKKELAGKRIGLLSSNGGSPGEPVREKFEAEFGRLDACVVIREKLGDAEKEGIIERFIERLGTA